ncbi:MULTISPECIES: ribonuclease III [Limnobacter]|nr:MULTISPECIES: ribonuclease III [Limnobacter]
MNSSSLQALQSALGHMFSQPDLLSMALTHRSFSAAHNERLEFLGDSVLNCSASILLYHDFPDMDEGKLSRIRSHLVKQDCLASIGRRINLESVLILGTGELKSASRIKDSIVADAVEALIGAVLLDAGFEKARDCVFKLLRPVLAETPIESLGKDPKTRLQELLQSRKKGLPVYAVLVEGGTSASPEFKVECVISDFDIRKSGVGHSRRVAEQQAAQAVLEVLLDQAYADPNQSTRRL